jgi:hypothetical protein
MEAIDDGHGSAASFGAWRGKQRLPSRFDNPGNVPRRMHPAKSGNRRKRMENVTHGAEAHHEQAKAGLRMQSFILAYA